MRIIQFMFKTSRGGILVAALLGGIAGLMNAVLLRIASETVTQRQFNGHQFMMFSGVLAASIVLKTVSDVYTHRMSAAVITLLRIDVCERALRMSLGQMERIGGTRILSVLTSEVSKIDRAFFLAPALINAVVTVVAAAAYGFIAAPTIFPIFFGTVVLVSLVSMPVTRRAGQRKAHQQYGSIERMYGALVALTQGFKELKMNRARRSGFFDEDLKTAIHDHIHIEERIAILVSIVTNAVSWAMYGLLGAGLYYGFNHSGASPEAISTALLATLMVVSQFASVGGSIVPLVEANVALTDLNKLSDELSNADEQPVLQLPVPENPIQSIRLEQVEYKYRREESDRSFTLGPIECEITAGKTIFIVGGNGSGKSTLVKVLMGLYQPESGRIVVNGRPIEPGELDAYRQNFSAVFADFHLFSNIRGIDQEVIDAKVGEHLKALRLQNKLKVEGHTLSTTDLSSGQRKRLALMVALLEDRPVFVFDEWASDQDPSFRRHFYRQILPELKRRNKTVIAITHDDRYFDEADEILKVEDGKIVDEETSSFVWKSIG